MVEIMSEKSSLMQVEVRTKSDDGVCSSQDKEPNGAYDSIFASISKIRQLTNVLVDEEEEFDVKEASEFIQLLYDIQDYAEALIDQVDERITGNWFDEEI